MILPDCQSLDQLEYFDRDEHGRIVLAKGVADGIVDCHAHLAQRYLLAPATDQTRLDFEALTYLPRTGNPIDLDVYSSLTFTPANAKEMTRQNIMQALFNNGWARTHSAANLIAEMDRTGVERAVIMAIDFPLGPFSRNSETHLAAAAVHPRLIPFVSVHSHDPFMERKTRGCHERGARGMKIHPAMQLVRANNHRVMELCRLCGELGLACLFHTGASDLAPDWQNDLPCIDYFWEAVEQNPDATFILGHAGIHQYREAIRLARAHDNVWLELSGQPPARIRAMLDAGLEDRMLFGSDWPYYPTAYPLAKVLLATEGEPRIRNKILSRNAKRLFDRPESSR